MADALKYPKRIEHSVLSHNKGFPSFLMDWSIKSSRSTRLGQDVSTLGSKYLTDAIFSSVRAFGAI